MSQTENNWVRARSTIVWVAAILTAFGAVAFIERRSALPLVDKPAAVQAIPVSGGLAPSADLPAPRPLRALTEEERTWARIAWTYFERNTDAQTGLAGSVEGFPSATLWDMASGLMALISAHGLGLVDAAAFNARMGRALASLEKLPLHGGQLPNKVYDVRSLAMTDYANQPAPQGVGWSAIDIGRLLVPLNVIAWQHPQHTAQARRILARWDTAPLARGGQLWGMRVEGAAPEAVQEGRLGYEQYAARTLALMGLDVDVAADWRAFLREVEIEGVRVPVDRREPKEFGAPNYVVSEPYVLAGLEFGGTRLGREAAWRVYRAQEARFRRTGTLTAVSEDHVDRPPYFVYNAVHSAGRDWVAVTEKGEDASALRTVSVKAAFGWHALYGTPYTQQLVRAIAPLHDPARGWYAGQYEQGGAPNKSLTANTNAVVLESLAYIQHGPFLRFR
jgi:hypothetical protein